MPPSFDVSKLKDLAKGLIGVPDVRTTKNFTKGCVIVIVIGVALLIAAISPIYGQHNIDLRTRELSPNARGTPSSLLDKYPGCGYLLSTNNSLSESDLKQALTKVRGGINFANNQDIMDGIFQTANKYRLSNVYIAAHGGLESAWGTSKIARDKKNLFGYGAVDSNPYDGANSFSTYQEGIDFVMNRVKVNYLTPGGKYYVKESTIPANERTKAEAIKRASGVNQIEPESLEAMNVYYASDVEWARKIKTIMTEIFAAIGQKPLFINNCPSSSVDPPNLSLEAEHHGRKPVDEGLKEMPKA